DEERHSPHFGGNKVDADDLGAGSRILPGGLIQLDRFTTSGTNQCIASAPRDGKAGSWICLWRFGPPIQSVFPQNDFALLVDAVIVMNHIFANHRSWLILFSPNNAVKEMKPSAHKSNDYIGDLKRKTLRTVFRASDL